MSLDPTFQGGIVSTQFNQNATCKSIAIQPDQKIVAAGYTSTSGGGTQVAISRYNTDGSLDSTFGVGGKLLDIISENDQAFSVLIDDLNRILICGYTDVTGIGTVGFLARYDQTGNADNSFGTSGKKILGTVGTNLVSVALQNDGKIIAGGYGGSNAIIMRFEQNGDVDNTFGVGGITTINNSSMSCIAVQPDQKIIFCGISGLSGIIVRVDADGNNSSVFQHPPLGFVNFINSVSLLSNGQIVGAGSTLSTDFTTFSAFVVLVNADLTMNTDFEIITLPAQFNSITVQPDQKVVAAGNTYVSGNPGQFLVARYLTSGSLDPMFNGTGYIVTTASSVGTSSITSVKVQTDNKIVVGGESALESTETGFALARYYNPEEPITNICFAAGTLISTDQGDVVIEQLTPAHTIRGQPVQYVTRTISIDKTLVRIERHALGPNVPSRPTIVSNMHKIRHKMKWQPAVELVNNSTILAIPYDRRPLYNVVLPEHTHMSANNVTVETLHPDHLCARARKLPLAEKHNLYRRLNQPVSQ